jgi:glyoxylase-like metal-dependent hydrolase (beta-lactamase superfamily II)
MSTGFKLNKIYRAGYCVGRGTLADRTLPWKKVRFYTRCFLLEHPKRGLVLIDTGYGKDLIQSTKKWIYSLYSALLPITYSPEYSIVVQLAKDGISLKDLSYLVLTHFHPDHIGALPEFTEVPWIYRSDSLSRLMSFSKLRGLKHGFIHTLVPPIPKRSIAISGEHFVEKWNSFLSIDLFGDGSLRLIDLPGHALGQIGVATQDAFFIADAKWAADALPHRLGFLFQQDSKAYRKTFESIQNIPLEIFPTHTIEGLCVKN